MRTLVPPVIATCVVAAALAMPARATPVCSTVPQEVCGGRIFAEAATSVSFVQHDSGEYEQGIKALEAQFPRYVKVRSLANLLNDPAARSAGGRPIWVIEITDFDAPEADKVPVMVSLSVHGNERAGLEGGVRYAEDLARWASTDPAHLLLNGTDSDSVAFPVSTVLERVHLYLADVNPDGWAKGDLDNGNTFSRTNDRGTDLNREFPTLGWSKNSYTPLSEPESQSWVRFTKQIDPRVTADLHGELTSVNNAFADMMYPAGQWNPLEQAQEDALARHMKSNVYRYFEAEGVVLGTITAAAADMKPADYATGYDVVGYDDSGFMGDYFTQLGAIDMDVEHFLSHTAPGNVWVFPLEQAHVAAVRAEIETMMVEAMVTDQRTVRFDLGTAGYLFDPRVVTDSDADGYGGPDPRQGYSPKSYAATPMRYFEDLAGFTTTPLKRLATGDVLDGLNDLDSFVVTDDPFPPDAQGRTVDRAAFAIAIDSFVKDGGNLILTDGGLNLLVDLGVLEGSAIARSVSNAGHINIDDFSDPYATGLAPTASQTYYEVPLGYSVDVDSAPHWTVQKAAWEAAGGKSIGHVDNANRIGLGRIEWGQGTIGIIGALLPTPTEKFDHYYGIADYGVTVAGGHILNQMLAPTWSGPSSQSTGAPLSPLPRF